MQHYLKPLKKTNPDIYFDDIKKSIQENFNQGLTLWAEKSSPKRTPTLAELLAEISLLEQSVVGHATQGPPKGVPSG